MEAQDILKDVGIRVTTPRVVIYDYLLKNRNHPTCETIYLALKNDYPSLSLASVYNVTEKLVDKNLLMRIVSPSGERHYDATMAYHGHFFCEKCNEVYDISIPKLEIENRLTGFKIDSLSFTANGECDICQQQK